MAVHQCANDADTIVSLQRACANGVKKLVLSVHSVRLSAIMNGFCLSTIMKWYLQDLVTSNLVVTMKKFAILCT